jgi:hypothetical protein
LPRPELLTLLKEREDKIVFGREVSIERRLGDCGARDHLLDSDGTDASA